MMGPEDVEIQAVSGSKIGTGRLSGGGADHLIISIDFVAEKLPAVRRKKYTPLARPEPSKVNEYDPAGKRPFVRTATSVPSKSYTDNRTTLVTDH